MTLLGARATMSFGSEADIQAWADSVALNPARLPPEQERSAELKEVLSRLQAALPVGLAGLAELSRPG
jgi:hypothetical protein